VLIVIESPDSVRLTLEIWAIGRPEPMRGFTRPVATLCTASIASSPSSSRRYPFLEECL